MDMMLSSIALEVTGISQHFQKGVTGHNTEFHSATSYKMAVNFALQWKLKTTSKLLKFYSSASQILSQMAASCTNLCTLYPIQMLGALVHCTTQPGAKRGFGCWLQLMRCA